MAELSSAAPVASADPNRGLQHDGTDILSCLARVTPDALVIHEDGGILHCNDQFLALLGYARADLPGLNLFDLVAAEDLSTVRTRVRLRASRASTPFSCCIVPESGYRSNTQRRGGLGLPVAHKLVRLHGGSLVIESGPGNGIRVLVRLPAHRLRPVSFAVPGADVRA